MPLRDVYILKFRLFKTFQCLAFHSLLPRRFAFVHCAKFHPHRCNVLRGAHEGRKNLEIPPPPDKRHYPHLQCTHADDEKGCLTFRGTCLLAIVQPWRVVLSPCDNELSVWRNDWLTKGIDGDVYRQCKLNKCSRIYSKTYQRHNVVHTIVNERKAMKS